MKMGTEIRATTPFGELAALQWGETGAPPLLALHGWLDNAASFSRLALLLASRRRVIALDLPGHGHSAHAPSQARRYHIVDQVDHVLDFADALGLDHFDLLGHSLGAGIASLIAVAAPARVDKLVLIEGLGPLADDGAKTLARWREAHVQRTRMRRKPRVFASVDAAVAARVAVDGLEADETRPMVERNLRQTDDGLVWRSDPRLRMTTPVRLGERQVRDLLAGVASATLALLATPVTPYLPSTMMQARAARVADIQVNHLAGPHHLHVRCPRQVAAKVLDFMASET